MSYSSTLISPFPAFRNILLLKYLSLNIKVRNVRWFISSIKTMLELMGHKVMR